MSGQQRDPGAMARGDLERAMLRAAASEEPSPDTVRRTLGAMGASGGGPAPATAAAAGARWLVRWGAGIGLCALVGAALWGAARGSWRPGHAAPLAITAPPLPALSVESAPLPAPSVDPAQPPSAVPATASAPVPPRAVPATPAIDTASGLAEEVAAIDAARATLDRGDAAGCLGQLDAYQRRFPRGTLRQEAAVMRIDALLRAGDRRAARALAYRLLAAGPGPYAERLRSLREAASGR